MVAGGVWRAQRSPSHCCRYEVTSGDRAARQFVDGTSECVVGWAISA